ncbi:MAG: hypothetical protein HDS35_07590 [Bacteroides sp.]|nr:hypothetical protein [Bacteroides sp.]
MAKKNVAALMSGLINMSETDTDEPMIEDSKKEIQEQSSIPSVIVVEKTRKRGRPQKENKVSEDRISAFNIESELFRKLKYIALIDDLTPIEEIREAIKKYVADWENENGKIRIPRKNS